MKVVIAASEAVPFAKTGGLADVAGTLAQELRAAGVDARLFLPLYRGINDAFELDDTGYVVSVDLGGKAHGARVLSHEGTSYFIECDEFFDRQELYGTSEGDYADNAQRFIFFSRAVLEACAALGLKPDVVHAHDWQTALMPLYIKTLYRKPFHGTASALTIHNLGYQGIFPATAMALTGLGGEWFTPSGMEFYGNVNFLKAGIISADAVTTVSESYSKEILTPDYGFGLEGVLKEREADIVGILNGLDYDDWDPATDKALPVAYSAGSVSGKQKCKRALAEECSFSNARAPIAGMVGRLSAQKGIDLFLGAADEILSCGINVVVLGKGDEEFQRGLEAAAKKHTGRLFVKVGFEEAMGRRIYASADIFLVPSHYEPCGLTQMIAMRYGAVPVVRATGGLRDTVTDYDHLGGKGTGFLFTDPRPSALAECVKRALCVYNDSARWKKLVAACMKQRFSWKTSAGKYVALYRKLARRAAG